MGYIIGLILILGLAFYSLPQFGHEFDVTSGIRNSVGKILSNLESKIYNRVFPKSQNELLINKLNSDYNVLSKFFDNSAEQILNSKNISADDKAALEQALSKVGDIKSTIETIQGVTAKDKGIVQSIVDKFLDKSEVLNPDPTSIPPQCKMVCDNEL